MSQLNAFRSKVGNKNATLGQYMNAQKGLTARKGGANDPSIIQSKLGAGKTAYNPSASKPDTISSAQYDKERQMAKQNMASKPVDTSAAAPTPKAGGFSSAPVVQTDKFQRDDKKKTDAQPMQESYVFVGDSKYRIV
jgi:hypothetical protein